MEINPWSTGDINKIWKMKNNKILMSYPFFGQHCILSPRLTFLQAKLLDFSGESGHFNTPFSTTFTEIGHLTNIANDQPRNFPVALQQTK